jgi:hypothetical protein
MDSPDIQLKRAVYDDIIRAPRTEKVVIAIPDEDFVTLKDHYRSETQIVGRASEVSARIGGTYFIKEAGLPAATASAFVNTRSRAAAIVTLHISRGPMDAIWRYHLRKSPDGWRIAKKELELAS